MAVKPKESTRKATLIDICHTSPGILLVYRVHLVMIVYKILAADTLCKGVNKLPKVGSTFQICATAHERDCSAPVRRPK
jgi:hypothetical protein